MDRVQAYLNGTSAVVRPDSHRAPPTSPAHPAGSGRGLGALHPPTTRPCSSQPARNIVRIRSAIGMADLWDIGERDSGRYPRVAVGELAVLVGADDLFCHRY